ncbi:MAG: restriction endonuclease subunit S [Candidatus Nitrosopumilus sp. bin_68KS]
MKQDIYNLMEIPWFSNIPNDWQLIKLKYLGNIITGNTPSTTDDKNYGGSFLWAGPTDLTDNIYVKNTEKKLTEKGKYLSRIIPTNSIMLCCIGDVGKLGISKTEMSTNQQINSIFSTKIDHEFLYFILKTNSKILGSFANTTVVPILNKNRLGNFKIICPLDESTQKQISNYLKIKIEKINDQISLYVKIVSKLEKKRSAQISKIISKGLKSNNLTQKTHISWLGNIPENWELTKFRKVIKKKNLRNQFGLETNMLSVSQSLGIIKKEYDSDTQIKDIVDTLRCFIVEPSDLVVNVMWLQFRGIGISFTTGIVSPDYHVYQINSKIIRPKFFNYLVRSDLYLNEYPKYLRGIRPNSSRMTEYDFTRLPIIIPPITEQDILIEVLTKKEDEINGLISNTQNLIEQLQHYRDSLIEKISTGKIDLSEVIAK